MVEVFTLLYYFCSKNDSNASIRFTHKYSLHLTNNFSLFVKVASMNSLETELLIISEGLSNKK